MKKLTLLLFPLLLCSLSFAQSTIKATDKPTAASIFDRSLTGLEREFVSLAEAMPDDKFNFAPTQGEFNGVRTFAIQVRHVAANNFQAASSITGEKPPAGSDQDNGPENLKSKAEIVQYLKDSFAAAHKAMRALTDQNLLEPIKSPWNANQTTRLRLAIFINSHPWDHYGQMVEYARMNGIIPPASRS